MLERNFAHAFITDIKSMLSVNCLAKTRMNLVTTVDNYSSTTCYCLHRQPVQDPYNIQVVTQPLMHLDTAL
jgi:hypothetical protein